MVTADDLARSVHEAMNLSQLTFFLDESAAPRPNEAAVTGPARGGAAIDPRASAQGDSEGMATPTPSPPRDCETDTALRTPPPFKKIPEPARGAAATAPAAGGDKGEGAVCAVDKTDTEGDGIDLLSPVKLGWI